MEPIRRSASGISAASIAAASLLFTACASVPPREQLRQAQKGNTRCLGDQSKNAKYRIVGVVPQFGALQTMEAWSPLLKALGENVHHCYRLEIASTIPEFEKMIQEGHYDYVYMNPFHQVRTRQHYEPLIRSTTGALRGVLIGSREKKGVALKDLKDLTLYLPAPNAFGASLLVRSALQQAGTSLRLKYVNTHSNTYAAVVQDPRSVGGMIVKTFDQAKRPGDDVVILFETNGYASHPYSAHRGVSTMERRAVQQALFRLKSQTDFSALLKKVRLHKPGPANYKNDYLPIEKLHLEKLNKP